MIRHIVCWDFINKNEETLDKAKKAQEMLNDLNGKIEGLMDIECIIDLLSSSNADMMLDSTLIDVKALNSYQTHPLHLEVAKIIKEICTNRRCMDYEV